MKEMTNLDIIFELYEKPYLKGNKKESNYHEITNFDIISYISKKIEKNLRLSDNSKKIEPKLILGTNK